MHISAKTMSTKFTNLTIPMSGNVLTNYISNRFYIFSRFANFDCFK